MKFKIQELVVNESEVKLWLERDGDSILLKGISGDEKSKTIMTFSKGKFVRDTDCRLDGLELDSDKRILEEIEEYEEEKEIDSTNEEDSGQW